MSNFPSISKSNREYIHISSARKKLNCSVTVVKGLCAKGDLVCIKAGGSWYVSTDSLAHGLNNLQRKRSNKSILISKLRNQEKPAARSSFNAIKRVIGREIRKK